MRSAGGCTSRTSGKPQIASAEIIQQLTGGSSRRGRWTSQFSPHFLMAEWEQVVDAWQLETWEAYRDVRTPGPQDAPAGEAAGGAVVDLRARSGPR